jgi:hypothetical protein
VGTISAPDSTSAPSGASMKMIADARCTALSLRCAPYAVHRPYERAI